jgi:hypothetical protein
MSCVDAGDSSPVMENRARPWAAIVFLLAVTASTEIGAMIRVVRNGCVYVDPLVVPEASFLMYQIGKFCFAAVGVAWLLTARRRRLGVQGKLGWLLLAFGVWIVASISWADDQPLVARRVVILAVMMLTAVAVADRFSIRDMMVLGFWSGIACLGCGLAAELILHTFAPLTAGYRFGGTVEPNGQGWNCSGLCLCAICLAADSDRARGLLYAMSAAALGFLVLTGSRTSLGGTCAALIVFAALRMPALRFVSLGLVATAGLAIAALLVDPSEIVKVALLNREEGSSPETFTGRTLLWQEFGSQVADSPLLGHGYGGFWTHARMQAATDAYGFRLTDAHSSYLDMALDLGLLGAAAFVSILFLGLRGYLRRYRDSGDVGDAFALALLIPLMTNMLFESRFVPLPPGNGSIFVFLDAALLIRLGFLSEPSLAVGDDTVTDAQTTFIPDAF